jgi:hypothetical protein
MRLFQVPHLLAASQAVIQRLSEEQRAALLVSRGALFVAEDSLQV